MPCNILDSVTSRWLMHDGGGLGVTWTDDRFHAYRYKDAAEAVAFIQRCAVQDQLILRVQAEPDRYIVVDERCQPPSAPTASNVVALLAVLREFIGDVEAAGVREQKEEWPDLYQTYRHAVALLRPKPAAGTRMLRCDGCGYEFPNSEIEVPLEEIPDLTMRLTPGGVVPDCECPECGAFAYEIKGEEDGSQK